jgi:hypothetical protein
MAARHPSVTDNPFDIKLFFFDKKQNRFQNLRYKPSHSRCNQNVICDDTFYNFHFLTFLICFYYIHFTIILLTFQAFVKKALRKVGSFPQGVIYFCFPPHSPLQPWQEEHFEHDALSGHPMHFFPLFLAFIM